MKIKLIIGFLVGSLAALMGQEYKADTAAFRTTSKKQFSITAVAGTSIFGGSWLAGSNYFMAPTISYAITPKLFINTSVGYNQMNFSRFGENGGFSAHTYTISTQGAYRMSEKLTVFGSVYKTIDNNVSMPSMNPQAINFNSQGGSVGFMYKLTDNITLGAEVIQHSGNNPFMRPPYYSGYNSGFYGGPSSFMNRGW